MTVTETDTSMSKTDKFKPCVGRFCLADAKYNELIFFLDSRTFESLKATGKMSPSGTIDNFTCRHMLPQRILLCHGLLIGFRIHTSLEVHRIH